MYEKYFFDIPIFRCTGEKWREENDREKEKVAKAIAGSGNQVTETHFNLAENWLRREFSSFYYNEMVGVIRLYAMNQQIRGELFFIANKRISRKLKNKKWRSYGKVFEFLVFEDFTNQSIFKKIIGIINNLQKNSSLCRNRYIDLETYSASGEYIDYKKLSGV